MIGITLPIALLVLTPAPSQDGPPGLVLVNGGKTKIGTTVKEIEPLIQENEPVANTLAGETPQHTVRVDDFYLMPNEVTNEQYAEFVEATGTQPPYYWGSEALEAGRSEWVLAEGKRVKEARERGEPIDRKKFDRADWWDENWHDAEWEVPQEELNRPVVYISYLHANAYASWAGLRLMSELEFQRAARGDSDRVYPWGDEWDDKEYCNSLHLAHQGTLPAGSFEKGASSGIFDLAGNVWEWTSSPYHRFDGYKPVKVKVGRGAQARTIEAMAGFDPNNRVLVSGSFSSPKAGVRIGLRQGAERSQRTEGLGFRCAADVTPGRTSAEVVIRQDIDLKVLPSDLDFYTEGAVAKQRWTHRIGTVALEGYAVITGYEKMMFCPVLSVAASNKSELSRTTQENPLLMGFVSFSYPLAEPALDGGTYLLAYRSAGKLKTSDDEQAANNLVVRRPQDGGTNFWDVEGFDAETDCFFFYNTEGEPVVAFPAGELAFKKMTRGSVTVEPFVPPTEEELKALEEQGEEAVMPVPMDTLRFSLAVAGKTKSKGILFDLAVKVEPGTIGEGWR